MLSRWIPPQARERWHSLWRSVPPLRALIETLIAQALLGLWAWADIANRSAGYRMSPIAAIIVLAGPCCILWISFRMRALMIQKNLRLLVCIGIGLVIAIIPSLLITAVARTAPSGIARAPLIPFFAAWLLAFTIAFLISRLGVRLLFFWDRLRRTHVQWALTHAHLMIVALGALLLSALIIGVFFYFQATSPSSNRTPISVLSVLPVLFLLFIVTVIALLIILPPSALFSYIFARQLTQQLQALATATTALREGDYSIRVQIQGEDEIAQLQSNFNAMATDLQRALHQVQQERDTITALLEARRQLIANVSHELRTPVATLRGYLESTRTHWDEIPPPSLRHDLDVMEHETISLQTLINDLFILSRAEVGKLDLHREPTDVGQLARHIVDTQAPLAWRRSRIEVAATVIEPLPLALVDVSRLEQVLQNLLHNALRHTPPGGIIVLSAHADDNMITLKVQDTGEGIAPEDLSNIWERFYRSKNTYGRPESGTGLGLALVKELTEAMGGSVAVESVVGQGSSFTIRVPRSPVDNQSNGAVKIVAEDLTLSSHSIS